MPIIFSTTTPASPACPPPARIYFEAPDDALLARVTEKVASILGRHQAYTFHEPSEVPDGRVPVVLNLSPGRGDSPPLRQPISPEHVQSLRDATDEPLAACCQALRDAGGDRDRAIALLRPQEIRRRSGKAS